MAHKTLVNGTSYEISGGKTLVNGTAYSISGGKTLVGGTAYEIGFGKSIGDLAVGSSVYMNVNGVSTEFLVVHQGLPDATLYDASCDGTWLLMKDIYEMGVGNMAGNAQYAHSSNHTAMNNTVLGLFDENIQSVIKQVKIPYVNGTGSGGSIASGSAGLSAKLFMLSGYEVGWTTSNNQYLPVDGACLDYFSGMAAFDAGRIAYYNGTAKSWWLRSPRTDSTTAYIIVYSNGMLTGNSYNNTAGRRPAMILPSDAKIDENFNVIA